jgi:hypothetical protein
MNKKNTLSSFTFLAGVTLMFGAAGLSADTIKPNGCKGPTLCDSSPIIDGCGWHIDIGVIVEQMRVSNSAVYYTHGSGSSTNPTWDNPSRYDVIKNPNFDLDAGVRVGIGYNATEHDDWNISANFEYLHSQGSISSSSEGHEVYRPLNDVSIFYTEDTGSNFYNANSSLSVDYYLLDIALSRGSYFSDRFSFEPFAGLKASWINYDASLRLQNDLNTADGIPLTTSWLRRSFVNFWGVGPMAGINANHHLFVGWSIFSSSNFSVLFGESNFADGTGFVTIEKLPFSQHVTDVITVLCPTLRSIIGLQYDTDIFKETQHVKIRFGFDTRYYFNQYPVAARYADTVAIEGDLKLNAASAVIENGSFGMVGLILDLGWDY